MKKQKPLLLLRELIFDIRRESMRKRSLKEDSKDPCSFLAGKLLEAEIINIDALIKLKERKEEMESCFECDRNTTFLIDQKNVGKTMRYLKEFKSPNDMWICKKCNLVKVRKDEFPKKITAKMNREISKRF